MYIPDLESFQWYERAGWFAVPRYGTWYRIMMRGCAHAYLLNIVPAWLYCPACKTPTSPGVVYEVICG